MKFHKKGGVDAYYWREAIKIIIISRLYDFSLTDKLKTKKEKNRPNIQFHLVIT